MESDGAAEEVSELIDRLGEPANMSLDTFIDFLEQVQDDVRTKLSAAKSDRDRGRG